LFFQAGKEVAITKNVWTLDKSHLSCEEKEAETYICHVYLSLHQSRFFVTFYACQFV
jgi:hypothetical protein